MTKESDITIKLEQIKDEISNIDASICTTNDEYLLTRYQQVFLEMMKTVVRRDKQGQLSPQDCATEGARYARAYFDELSRQIKEYD